MNYGMSYIFFGTNILLYLNRYYFNYVCNSSDDDGDYQTLLQQVELPLIPRDECQRLFRRTKLGPRFQLDQSFICAGGEENVDTCKGDGGGPLVCPLLEDPNRYVQVIIKNMFSGLKFDSK